MLLLSNKKNKINLCDYNYQQDLKNRLLMAQFSQANVDVLEEILNSSIKIEISRLIEDLELSEKIVFDSIEIFENMGLLKIEKDLLVVNKEMRKYYEFQILKFDEDFQPNLEFVQGLLRKVPIHVLPIWYNLPRTCDNIFQSIVEKYLITPRTFEKYFEEIQAEDPIISSLTKDIQNKKSVLCEDLRKKYDLSKEDFVLYILHLEFNFLAFLSYTKIDGQWHEVLKPLHEWSEYCRFKEKSHPKALEETIKAFRHESFAFTKDSKKLLEICYQEKDLTAVIEALSSQEDKTEDLTAYAKTLVKRLCEIKFLEEAPTGFSTTSRAKKWLEMPLEEQAIYFFCQHSNYPSHLQNERNIRCIEKSLLKLTNGWVSFEAFLHALSCGIGHTEGVQLRKKGRLWKYEIPQYNKEEKDFVHTIIFERLFQAGLVDISKYQEKEVFRLNDFGKQTLT